MNCSTVIYIEITEKTCFNCIYLPIAALVRYQAGSTTLNRFRLNQEGKTIKTKAGSLNIPWVATGFIFIRDYLRQFMQEAAHICSRNFKGHGQGVHSNKLEGS